MLISLDKPLECGKVVTTDGSCFYDSVLANLEEPEIRQSIASHVRNITSIQDLRSCLAHFMDINTMLHGLEQFQMQREITLTDKKLTWTRYLEEIRKPNEFADELVMFMAIFLGKDITHISLGG